jgi:hypothetical protein
LRAILSSRIGACVVVLPNEKEGAMDMDRFVNDQNIERFRKLASASTNETDRRILLGLLAEENAKFIDLQKARAT